MIINFICSTPGFRITSEDFSQGVGGTVSATITQAESLAELGYHVFVYSDIENASYTNGVTYFPFANWNSKNKVDIAIFVNEINSIGKTANANLKVGYYHDTRLGGSDSSWELFNNVELFFADSLFGVHQFIAKKKIVTDKIKILPIPIHLGDYSILNNKKFENKILYSSVPDRGLIWLIKWFPELRNRIPDLKLTVTGDFTLYGRQSGLGEIKKTALKIPGIDIVGQVSRSELVDIQKECSILAYPCMFPEGFCIAAAESLAAGTVPVTSDSFALKTTVGQFGCLIPGYPRIGRRHFLRNWIYKSRFIKKIFFLLENKDILEDYSKRGRDFAFREFSPGSWARRFMSIVKPFLERKGQNCG